MAGNLAFEVVRQHVDDVVLVSDDEIAAAMKRIITYTKLVAEGAGAAATAAVLAGKLPLARGSRVVAILSGGNVDSERLKQLL
jgi:threonine dehydratase